MSTSRLIAVANTRAINLKGFRSGRLSVLEFNDIWHGSARWKCRCDCGEEVLVAGYDLRNFKRKRCGRACPLNKLDEAETAQRLKDSPRDKNPKKFVAHAQSLSHVGRGYQRPRVAVRRCQKCQDMPWQRTTYMPCIGCGKAYAPEAPIRAVGYLASSAGTFVGIGGRQ